MYCLGDQAGPNIVAGYQESLQKDFIYGNELFGASSLQQIHYMADSGDGMEDRNGTLYYFSNTLDTAQNIFDTGSNGNGFYGYLPPRVDARNNIFWTNHAPYNGAQIQLAFSTQSSIIMSATTNLMTAGTFTIQAPVLGAPWANNTDQGWSSACDGPCRWPLTTPLDPHLYGLTDTNYLSTATQPYDPTTMVPPAGSAAINAGSPLTGILQTMPVRWQYSIATSSLIPRLNPQTIGAVDYAAETVTPTFSPSAGDYTAAPTVSIETTTPSANIYYTTDGSTPTFPPTGTTTLYGRPITVASTETVHAIAIAPGSGQSTVASATYEVGPLAATPAFSPAGGTYNAAQTVTISDTTSGAKIYYTIDGTTPSAGSAVYSGPITVSANETVQAIAAAPGFSSSNVGSAAYTIGMTQTAAPTFTPTAGAYSAAQTVALSDATPGALIYYTTNGGAPTAASTLYSGPISVSTSETVQAIAISAGASTSAVAKAAYNITLPLTGPVYVQQCNSFVQFGNTISCTLKAVGAGHSLVIAIAGPSSGKVGALTASSGTPVRAISDANTLSAWVLPNTGAGNNTIMYSGGSNAKLWLTVVEYGNTAASPLDGTAQANLSTSWQASGLLNTPNFTTSSASDALWSFCLGDAGTPTVGTAPIAWTGMPTPPSGTLLVETGSAGSAGVYHGQCTSNEGEIIALALKPGSGVAQAASPVFSLASGTYTSAQSVTISDATPGATIYYTTNGTAPTPASNVYGGPITVSASETIEAIAASTSTAQSSIASAVYNINSSGTTPTIHWPAPAAIAYGTALSAAQLNATASVAGTFMYSPASGILTAGNHALTATFTPTDTTDFTKATASVILTVNKAAPPISWAAPAAMTLGAILTAAQLDATSTVAGTFSYSPSLGTLLAVGSQKLTATFTPTDISDYSIATASVTLSVIASGIPPAFVQQCNQSNQYGTTASCTLSGVGAGHALVIGVAGAGTQSGRVTASVGTPIVVVKDGSILSAYLLANTSAGSITITYTTNSNTKIHLSVAEYANTAASPLDGSAGFVNSASSNSVSTPIITTTTASDLLWSYCATPGGSTLTPGTAPILWTKRISPNGTGAAVLVEDGVTTSSGKYYGQCTGPNEALEIITLALKP
jgi:hypothetical protein